MWDLSITAHHPKAINSPKAGCNTQSSSARSWWSDRSTDNCLGATRCQRLPASIKVASCSEFQPNANSLLLDEQACVCRSVHAWSCDITKS